MAKKKKEDEKEKSRRKVEAFRQQLRVTLTTEEVASRADRAAHVLAERDQKEEEAKAAQKHLKSIIDNMEAEMRRLSNEVRDHATYQLVDCERVYDYETGRVSEIRKDTGESVNERAMTLEERQQELSFGDVEDEFSGDGDDKKKDDEAAE